MIEIEWQVGQTVIFKKRFHDIEPYGAIGNIEGTTATQCIIRFSGYGLWKIPRSIMHTIEEYIPGE